MTTETKHTPTPWKAIHTGGKTGNTNSIVNSTTLENVAQNVPAETAAFIVRACNAHEELVEAAFNYVRLTSIKHEGTREEKVAARQSLKSALGNAGHPEFTALSRARGGLSHE